MKKILAVLTACVVSAMIIVSGTAAAEEGRALVVLGDSIASGFGLDGYASGNNYSASDSFANQLGTSYSDYQNFAVDGRTSGELLAALADENISKALGGADTVVVSIGGNDFLQPMIAALTDLIMENTDLIKSLQGGENFDAENYLDIMREYTEVITTAAKSVDTDEIGKNLEGILGGISGLNPECQTIILTVYNPFDGVAGMELIDVVAREKLAELNNEITAAAEKFGADVADVYTAFKGHSVEYTNISSMDIHPNQSGHAVIYSLLSDMTGAAEASAVEAMQPVSQKGSPDTGAGGIAVFVGAAVFAAGVSFAFRKKR